MKLVTLIFLVAAINTQLHADRLEYNITVDNWTNWGIRVEIWNERFCDEPNGGDYLPAHKKDWWPTHNGCMNYVKLHYPDGSTAKIEASIGYNNFVVYQNEKGEFHWK